MFIQCKNCLHSLIKCTLSFKKINVMKLFNMYLKKSLKHVFEKKSCIVKNIIMYKIVLHVHEKCTTYMKKVDIKRNIFENLIM